MIKRYSFLFVIFFSICAVYLQVFNYPRFNPEWALFFQWNYGLSVSDLVAWYNPWNPLGWYRPTSFIAYYQIVTQFIGWHNISAFHSLGLMLLAVFAVAVYFFSLQIFQSETAAILSATLAAIHPVIFPLVYYLFSTDHLYQIFILISAIIFCSNILASRHRLLWMFTAFTFYLLAITSKEQAIALPIFSFLVVIIEYLFRKTTMNGKNKQLFRNRLILCFSFVAVTLTYVCIRIPIMGYTATGEYRTGLNLETLISNIKSGPLWLSHIFLFDSNTWNLWGIHNSLLNNFYGFLMLIFVVSYIVVAIINHESEEIRKILIVISFLLAFIIMPIYNGGRPWHYILPATAFTMLYARAVSTLLQIKYQIILFRYIYLSIALLVAIGLSH